MEDHVRLAPPWRGRYEDIVDQPAQAPSRADKAEKVFTLAIFAYSLIRVVPVWRGLEAGSVNPWVFLAIDLATAYPYAKAWPRMLRALVARRPRAAMLWALVLMSSFLAPYLYVAVAGEDVASWVWWILGAFVAVGVLSAGLRVRDAVRKPRHARDFPLFPPRRVESPG